MELNEFNYYYINNLLDKLSKENKTVFLLGDFNAEFTTMNSLAPFLLNAPASYFTTNKNKK